MKDRRISVNIRKLLDIMHYTEEEDIEAVVLSLDFVKCFDKCSFSILHGSLDFFKFGSIVRKWTEILYKNYTVKIQNNGHFSDKIDIEKGVHQGGCCSSIYFLVIAEILAISLRNNNNIKGITINEIINLLNQFADDMDICFLSSKESLENIIQELRKFHYHSGFEVSYDKTTLYRIGSLRHSNAQMYDMTEYIWSNNDITVLGITIAHENIVDKNYNSIVKKVENILEAWYNRGLSLYGKIQVVNTLIASQFVYKMMVLPTIPEHIIKNIDNVIRRFIWNGKKAKISYKILQNSKKEGGLKLVNLKNKDIALKATWPQILQNEDEYSQIVWPILKAATLKENIWRCNLSPKDVKYLKIKSEFWKDVLTSWCEYNYRNWTRAENQIIWYNSDIKINNKVFMWNDMYEKGLLYVHQLYANKNFKTFQQIYEEFGLSKMRYNSLKMAIPKYWKQTFTDQSLSQMFPLAPHNYDYAINVYRNNFSRRVYAKINSDILLIHSKYIKWKHEIGPEFAETIHQYASLHMYVFNITPVAKYISFQYRLLQRGLITNVQLYKWNISNSDRCYYCNIEKETIVHLFCECERVQCFWGEVEREILCKFADVESLQLNVCNIIANTIVKDSISHVGNFICLIAKHYIYSQKCLKKELCIKNFKAVVSKIRNIEKYIAIKNQCITKYSHKWERENNVNREVEDHTKNFVMEYIEQM